MRPRERAPKPLAHAAVYADLHVHSRFSRATSRDGDVEHLAHWAAVKGLGIVGTGDFTHPGWLAELRTQLTPAEPGLFRLRTDAEAGVRFLLSAEIATVYAQSGRTRRVHHVICVPSFGHVDRLRAALSRIGNLDADGRPILGLDARDLLELVLESGPGAFLFPAHIWTPWYAVLGSKSGFDGIAECYRDLTPHVFAVETGLSSDPPMNRRVSALDGYRLVSNSDAHSPAKLGREATVFACARDFFALRAALETGAGYGGTIEYFPEAGKYHWDGHRACHVGLEPAETRRRDGRCPVCGAPVTAGVMHRVEALADRAAPGSPKTAAPHRCLIPLADLLAETEGVGASSARVTALYERLIEQIAPELPLLDQVPIEVFGEHGLPRVAEAIRRVRAGEVVREPGYDGLYGRIRVFAPDKRVRASVNGAAG